MSFKEFEFIELLSKLLPKGQGVEVGVGDDAAVVKAGKTRLAVSTDALVEGTHFLKTWKKLIPNLYRLLGKKLISISASDLASTGAKPLFATVTVGAPELSEELVELYEGLSEKAKELGTSIVGGDTVKGKELFLELTLIGTVEKPLLRSKAKPGQLVAVSGTLGDAYGGLKQLLKGEVREPKLIERFLNPKDRVKEGLSLAKLGVKCATDVSDGFLFNLKTVAESSKVAIKVKEELIPISESLVNLLGRKEAKRAALFGGEDYELITTFEPELEEKVKSLGFSVVGRVEEGEGVFLNGKKVETKGFDHFKE
jgi:thiamine-monophosphate kinase